MIHTTHTTTKLMPVLALLTLPCVTYGADACQMVTKAEMSGLLGAEITQVEILQIGEGAASVCHFVTGEPPQSPSAILIVTESQGVDAIAQWCEGVQKLEGIGDQACAESAVNATSVAASKGDLAVRVILFYPPDRIAEPHSAAKKATQKALDRMRGLQIL